MRKSVFFETIGMMICGGWGLSIILFIVERFNPLGDKTPLLKPVDAIDTLLMITVALFASTVMGAIFGFGRVLQMGEHTSKLKYEEH